MAQTIQITTQVNLDDSQFKNKTREVLDFVQTLSKTKAYISPKLKFNTGDIRKELQAALSEAYRDLEKAYGVKKGEKLTYAGPKGGVRTVNTKEQQKRALEYFSARIDDKSLSQAERNQAERIVSAHRKYNDLIRQIQDLDRRARKAFTRSLDVDDEKLRSDEFKQFTRTNRRGKNIAATKEAIEEARTAVVRRGTITSFYPDNLKNYGQEIKALQDLIAKKKELFRQEGRGRYYTDQEVKDARARIDALRQEKAAREQAAKANKEQLQYNKAVFDASVKRRKEAANAAKHAQSAADKQENAQNRIIRQYQQQYGILGGLGSRLRSYISIYALANFGKKVAETTGYFEKQQVALEGILGSASKAQQILSQIKDFALRSPFQTKELVNYTKQLSAFSIPADELFDTTKRLADISAGLGVDMGRIILAYGQVRSAAVLRGQELRQFTEAGIPLVQKLAEKFTQLRGEVVTTADVFELISKRQVSFQMVADVLSDMTKEGGQFYKMQENITETLYGQMQKLQDMWTIKMDEMGKAPGNFLMNVVKLLQLIIKNANGVAAGLIVAFSLNWAIRNIRAMRMEWQLMDAETKRTIGSLKQFRRLRLLEFGKNLGWGLAAAGVGYAVGAIYQYLRSLGEVQRKMAEISNSFNKETNKMIGGFDNLVQRLRSAKVGTQAYNDAIETLKSNYGEFVNVNQETIATLLSEQKSIDGSITEYQKLRDEIAAAIKLKQEFNELKTQKETLSGIVASNAEGSQFWGTGYKASNQAALTMFANILAAGGNQAQRGDALNSLFGTNYESTSTYSKLLDDLNKVSNETYTEFTSKGLKYKGDFQELFKRNFENQFMLNNFATSPDSSISNWVTNISSTMFAKMTQEQGWKDYVEAVDKLAGKGTDLLSSMIRINNEFDKFNPGENEGVGAVGRQNWQNVKYIEFLSNVTSEFEKLGGNANKLQELRDVIAKNDPNSIKDITDAIDEFLKTITDPKRREVVSDAKKRFVSGTEALTAQEEEIAERMSKDATWAGINRGEINGVKIQSVIDNYNPAGLGEQTVQQTRDKLRSAYDDLRKELKTYTKNAELFKDDIALINAKMRVIERLAKSDLYAVDLTEKNGGGGSGRDGWRRLFADLFSYIKEARAEEKKLVEHSAGLTEELANQIFSGQLEGTAVNAFWSEGSPFKKFVDKMDEYGLETEVFSKDFLKGALSDIATKQIKATGTINFEDVWSQLIAVIKGRADELSKNPKMEKTVESILTYLQQMTMEGEKIFSRDKVEKLISDQLKQMQRINANVEAIKSSRAQFERISSASNYLQAQQAVYGTSPYRHIKQSGITGSHIQRLLREGVGSGLASTDLGNNLLSFVGRSGNFNIENLGELERIRKELKKEAARVRLEDVEGETPEERQANFDNMKGVLGQFDGLVKQLIEDIIKEFEEMMKLKDPITKGMDDIINAFRTLADAEDTINKGQSNGDLSESVADRMRIQALQAMYQSVTGIQNPSYLNLLFGQKDTMSGLSSTGQDLAAWLGNPIKSGRAEEIYKQLKVRQYDINANWDNENYEPEITGENRVKARNDELSKAAEEAAQGLAEFTASMDMAVAVIQKVNDDIQKLAKAANDFLDMMEATNGLTTDKYGNYTYEMDLDTTRQAISLISEFSSNLSGAIQSFMTGDIVGGFAGAISTISNLVENILGIGDTQVQKGQDKLISSNKALERSLNELNQAIKGEAGINKWANLTQQIANLQAQQTNNQTLESMEVGKKHGDASKAEEYRKNAEELGYQIEDIIRGIQEEIFGTADELASKLTDPLVDAFRNGENAARSWRDAVRGYIADVLKEVLMTKVVAPQIQNVLDTFMGKATAPEEILAKFKDVSAVKDLRGQLFNLGDWLIENFESLPKEIQEMIGWNNSTSELSGGIQGITEDTARTLEGLANSILAQHVITNRYLGEMAISGFAQVQLSWFTDMQNLQRQIASNTKTVSDVLAGSRDGTRSLLVRME